MPREPRPYEPDPGLFLPPSIPSAAATRGYRNSLFGSETMDVVWLLKMFTRRWNSIADSFAIAFRRKQMTTANLLPME
jgi:hypothetical protein